MTLTNIKSTLSRSRALYTRTLDVTVIICFYDVYLISSLVDEAYASLTGLVPVRPVLPELDGAPIKDVCDDVMAIVTERDAPSNAD